MQQPGNVCEGCKDHWTKQGLQPKKLGRASGSSMNKKMLVPLCGYCDGDSLLITAMGNHGAS